MTSTATGVLPAGFRLRKHQALALEALRSRDRAGHLRSWVVLPPGAGKTLVGLVTASELLDAGVVSHVVVLSPNTAIQGAVARAGDPLRSGLGRRPGPRHARSRC